MEMPPNNCEVFLSHASSDKPVVERIALRLREAGVTPWLDRWNLIPGQSWQPAIEQALKDCASVAVFIGPKGLAPWHHEEMRAAIQRRVAEPNVRVIPVLLPGAVPEERGKLPSFLAATTWVEFATEDDTEAVRRLVCGIRGLPPGPAPAGPMPFPKKPYRGLEVFDVDDADIFFGREALTDELLRRLKQQGQHSTRFLAILGSSGSGKSSLARAGLLAALKAGKLTGSETWPQVVIRPGDDPLRTLGIALLRLQPSSGIDPQQFVGRLAKSEQALDMHIRVALPNDKARMVLLVDQAEEIFSLCADEAKRKSFLENVMYAATAHSGQLVAILAMRADFYPRCASHSQLAALVSEHQLLVGAMSPEELRRAIEIPAIRANRPLKPELVERLIHDVAARPGALPLLEHALGMLWELRCQSPGLDEYRQMGGVAGALDTRAEKVFHSLSADERSTTRQLFVTRLVQLEEGTADTRRRVAGSELSDKQRSVSERFAEAGVRLLVWGGDHAERYVELAHEAVMYEWKRLAAWLSEDREVQRIHQRLRTAAMEWASRGKLEDELYPRSRLGEVEEWLQKLPSDESGRVINELERDFVARSKEKLEHAEREREAAQKRLERALEEQAAAAKRAEEQRKVAVSRELSAVALAKLEDDPVVSLSLLKTATGLAQTEQLDVVLTQWARSPFRAKMGHTDSVLTAGFSPDGRYIVTASRDKTARVWDSETGSLLQKLEGHTGPVRAVGFSPDGRRIVTASRDKTARVWDSETGSLLQKLEGHMDSVWVAEFSPDGRRVVTASSDKTAWVWDSETGSLIQKLEGHMDSVWAAGFSPDGRRIVTASRDRTARVWDSVTGSLIQKLEGHTEWVLTAEFSPDGQRVVTASDDKTARVWDSETGSLIQKLEGHTDWVWAAGFAQDGHRIVTASQDRTARIWDSETGSLIQKLEGHTGSVLAAKFSPDGRRIVTASRDKTARVWNSETGSLIKKLKSHMDSVRAAEFSPDGQRVVTASRDETARVWNLEAGSFIQKLEGHTDALRVVEFSPDGRHVVTASDDKTARIWDSESGSLIQKLEGHTGSVLMAGFGPDGRRVITASRDETARVWDLETGSLIQKLEGHTGPVLMAEFSPDGRRVITASRDETARVWDLETGSLIQKLEGVLVAKFSPDGRRVVTASRDKTARIWDSNTGLLIQKIVCYLGQRGLIAKFNSDGRRVVIATGDKTAQIWDSETGSLIQKLKGHTDSVRMAEFSPDGRHVVTASRDKTARIWDSETGSLIQKLKGHTDSVRAAEFSPDGRHVVTASADKTARVWEWKTGTLIQKLEGHTDMVRAAKFSSDGRCVVTASADKTARLWRDSPAWWPRERQLKFLESVRDLTHEERRLYLHEDEK